MIGCVTTNINTSSIVEKKEHIILGLTWQIIRNQANAKINLKNNPYLIRLLNEGEEISELLKLSPEQLLIRWFNYHLKNAGHDRRIKNFTTDLKDAVNYTVLLN
jgi:plastin-1